MKKYVLAAGLMVILACNNQDLSMSSDFYKLYDSKEVDLGKQIQRLSSMNIYFGHQSVGANIIRGLQAWSEELGIPWKMIATRDFEGLDTPAFVHFGIGKNEDPIQKIDDFVQVVSEMATDSGAVAFFKFCYDDFFGTTEVDPIFKHYKEEMLKLKENYPQLRIVLCTVPYTALQKGLRALVKKILSMPLAGELENIKRSAFNKLMMAELSSDFPIFDLGRIESIRPDGKEITYTHDGAMYPAMTHLYTEDLGHLNTVGSRVVAYNLISFLATEVAK